MELKKKKLGKRISAIILTLALVLGSFYSPQYAQAAGVLPETDFDFTIRADNTVIINGFKNDTATVVHIPKTLDGVRVTEIGKNAFIYKTKIQELYIPDTINKIGDYAFAFNSSIKNLVIPGSVKYVGRSSFFNCTSLEKLTLLYGIETIGSSAFSGCTRLSDVQIAASVGDLYESTFQKVANATIEAEPGSPAADYKGDGTTTVSHSDPTMNSPIVYAYETAPDGTVIIKEYVGSNKTPVIPSTINGNAVTSIGDGAFQNKPVTSVTLPDSIKTLGSDVFAGTNITELILPAGVTSIGENLIDNKPGIIIKSDSPYVEEYISKYYTSVRFEPYKVEMTSYHKLTINTNGYGSITLGANGKYKDGVKVNISAQAYRGYTFNGWTVSGQGVFDNATKTSTVFTMSSSDVVITANFEASKRPDVVYLNGTFMEYNIVGNLVIAENYKASDENPTLVPTTAISPSAFEHNVDGRWYYGYPITVSIPKTMETIPEGVFSSCNLLTKIEVVEPNSHFTSENGVLFNEDKTVLLSYPRGNTADEYVMPNTVISIAPNAFYGSSYLKKITFSSNLTTIGSGAFTSCSSLTEIDLPDSVTTIGSNAFSNCGSLSSVTIKAGVTEIGSNAFYGCYSLKSITVKEGNPRYRDDAGVLYDKTANSLELYPPKKVAENYTILDGTTIIRSGAFYSASMLKNITIPDSVTTVGSGAFQGCSRLEAIAFPAGITVLPSSVLSGCSSLQSITLNEGLKTISSYAFNSCSSLSTITIPASVTSISEGIFFGCTALTDIHVIEENTAYMDEGGILYNIDQSKLITYPAAKEAVEGKFTPNANTTAIASRAFSYSKLKEVDLKETVGSIGYEAFAFCSQLNNVIMRNKQIKIQASDMFWGTNVSKMVITGYFKSTAEKYAFDHGIRFRQIDEVTGQLVISNDGEVIGYTGTDTVITIPSTVLNTNNEIISVTTIGKNAFRNPNNPNSKVFEKITEVRMPIALRVIKDSAFTGCISLTSDGLVLPEGLTIIESNAFTGCTALTSITIPQRVNKLNAGSFDGCTSLTEIKVSSSNGTYADIDGVLTNKSKKTIFRVPIAFTGDNGLYEIPKSVTAMGASAMDECTGINNVHIYNLNLIEQGAFKNAFTSPVVIDLANVDEIDSNAFEGCSGITTINIPKSVTRLGENVFYDCDNLTEIKVDADNTKYADVDGVLFNKNKQSLILYPKGRNVSTYRIPDGVYQIYDNAFNDCQKLTNITMPNSVIIIGNGAFSKTMFTSITLSQGLEEIGDAAFSNAGNLSNISIPSHVDNIGAGAFEGCVKLGHAYVYSENVVYSTKGNDVFKPGEKGQTTLTLHGYAGSTTEKYALAKNIAFQVLLPGDIDKENLVQAVADATMMYDKAVEGTGQGEFAAGSKATLKSAIDAAKAVLKQNATSAQLQAALTTLQNAIKAFEGAMVPYDADKSQLTGLYNAVGAIYGAAVEGAANGEYEVGSKAVLLNALNAAQTAMGATAISQNEVDRIYITLQSALVEFQRRCVTSSSVGLAELSAGVTIAQARYGAAVEGTAVGQYAAGSKATYLVTINTANNLLLSLNTNAAVYTASPSAVSLPVSGGAVGYRAIDSAAQVQVNGAVKALVSAGIAFDNAKVRPLAGVYVGHIKVVLPYAEDLYNGAVEGTALGNYPVGKKAELKAVIEDCYLFLSTAPDIQSLVDAKFNTLQMAINEFEASKVTQPPSGLEKTPLRERLDTAAAKKLEGIYSQGSMDILDAAITYGLEVYNNAAATDINVTTAMEKLDQAIRGLVLK